jgi:DNA-binding transcriptional LysR family regulator
MRDPGPLNDLRLGDLATFLAVKSTSSVSSAARALGVTPSQVSKAIARVETALDVQLLTRGARGVSLSDEGRRLAPRIEQMLEGLRVLHAKRDVQEAVIAFPSSLGVALAPRVATALEPTQLRAIELGPSLMRAYASENLFDVAILPGETSRLPASWTSVKVGDVRMGLFAPPELAKPLGAGPVSPAKLRGAPFVVPAHPVEGSFAINEDDCPLPRRERTVRHQAQTFNVALELAARCGLFVYGPVLAAREHLDRRVLVEVDVKGWDVREPLHVSCDPGRLLARVQSAIVRAVRDALADDAPRDGR